VSAAAFLEELRAAGAELLATADGKLRWRCRGIMPAGFLRRIAEYKAGLLALLRPEQRALDQAEADRLFAALQAEVRRIGREEFGGRMPPDLGYVLRTWVEVAEYYIHNLEKEVRRGFDVIPPLRRMAENVRKSVANWKALRSQSASDRSG
jgi:hypothetical protein